MDAAVAVCLTGTRSKLWSLFAVLKCLPTAERHTFLKILYSPATIRSSYLPSK